MIRLHVALSVLLLGLACQSAADEQSVADLRSRELFDLIELRVEIDDELRRRGVMRSANQLTGELAEYLFAKAFGWQLSTNSQKSFDAVHQGIRYQIKARRDWGQSGARQLSAIRNPEGFDFLAVIIFDRFYRVEIAVILPSAIVTQRARYVAYTNSYRIRLTDDLVRLPGARDVTGDLKR